MDLVDISRSSNYSSEIYRKWIWLIYLAWVISQARYIKNGFGWYILAAAENVENMILMMILKWIQKLATLSRRKVVPLYFILLHCYEPVILLPTFRWTEIQYIMAAATIYQPNPFFNISRSSNYSSEIYRPNPFSIYLAWVITRARYIKQSHFRYISLE